MSDIDVKSLIVESATKFFSKFGFHKTTMNEISKHIHKAKGVLYYYFGSKEELFNEVLKKELGQIKIELSKILNSDNDSLTILKDYFLARLKLLHTALNYQETLKADFFEKYHFVNDVREDFDEFERNHLTLIIEKGIKEGFLNVKDAESTVKVLMMIINGIEIPLFLQNKYSEFGETLEELSTMIINSLRIQKK